MSGHEIISSVTTIIVAIIGLATLAVILGRGAQTSNVLDALGRFLSSSIKAATGPVSGGFVSPALNIPSSSLFSGGG